LSRGLIKQCHLQAENNSPDEFQRGNPPSSAVAFSRVAAHRREAGQAKLLYPITVIICRIEISVRMRNAKLASVNFKRRLRKRVAADCSTSIAIAFAIYDESNNGKVAAEYLVYKTPPFAESFISIKRLLQLKQRGARLEEGKKPSKFFSHPNVTL
jgi:hypothetical protein